MLCPYEFDNPIGWNREDKSGHMSVKARAAAFNKL